MYYDLQRIAYDAMKIHGLEPDVPPEALRQLEGIHGPAPAEAGLADLTRFPWCSIDNDDSRDLDQLTVAEKSGNGAIRIRIAVADVDALLRDGTPLDLHARRNTTSVYTGVRTFPMLPDKLCTDLTSLNEDQDRTAMIVEMTVDRDGRVDDPRVHRARVRNHAKLTYHGVGDWLEEKGPLPEAAARVPGLDACLRLQDEAARRLRELRHEHGALDLETLQPRPVTRDGAVVDLTQDMRNPAGELIEDFMIAANGVTARFLAQSGFPVLRRVVRSPERWARIVEVAATIGEDLPGEPDSKALSRFLLKQRAKDPDHFPDLSLTVVKLMGRGEYVPEMPGRAPTGHFGLAVSDYSHSTAPNRRYPDLLTHRLLKAALSGKVCPYTFDELSELASHCTRQEDAANKTERQVRKSASAAFLSPRVGESFEGFVTGASEKGTWVRVLRPPVEGKVVQNSRGMDVGDRVRVKLIGVDVLNGYIDFAGLPGK